MLIQNDSSASTNNGYKFYNSPYDYYNAAVPEGSFCPVSTDATANLTELAHIYDNPYTGSDHKQNEIIACILAIVYSKLGGIPCGCETVSYSSEDEEEGVKTSADSFRNHRHLGIFNSNGVVRVPVITMAGQYCAVVIPGSRGIPVVVPVPALRVSASGRQKLDKIPFIRELEENETVKKQFEENNFKLDYRQDRDQERKFDFDLGELSEYPQTVKELKAYLQFNQLDRYNMISTFLNHIGGPLDEDELASFKKEVPQNRAKQEVQEYIDQVFPDPAKASGIRCNYLCGYYGGAKDEHHGEWIFGAKLPITLANGHNEMEYRNVRQTDLYGRDVLILPPINPAVWSDEEGECNVSVEYTLTVFQDPVSVLVTCHFGKDIAVSKRYSEADFVQVHFPSVISMFNGNKCEQSALYSYALDESDKEYLSNESGRLPSVDMNPNDLI